MTNMQNTKAAACPNCSGELRFDPQTSKIVCDYCGSEFTNEEIDALIGNFDNESLSETHTDDSGNDMRYFGCSSCGAEMAADENTAAMRCPFCGNNTVVPAQFSGEYRPDHIIPFGFTKQQAEQKYKDYYSGKKLLPKSFLSENSIEDIQGVYVPFMLFSGRAEIQAHYEASDVQTNRDEKITKIFDVRQSGNVEFENVPADASKRMPDDLMDSIEPYKFDQLKPFSMSYMPGFIAERYNVSSEEDRQRAENRVKSSVSSMSRKRVKHEHIDHADENISLKFTKREYALMPVWYLITNWNGKQWTFAMNGQTGKFIGDLPIDKGKMTGIAVLTFIISFIVSMLLIGDPLTSAIIGIVITGIAAAICYGSMKPVSNASDADDYMNNFNLTEHSDKFVRSRVQKKENK